MSLAPHWRQNLLSLGLSVPHRQHAMRSSESDTPGGWASLRGGLVVSLVAALSSRLPPETASWVSRVVGSGGVTTPRLVPHLEQNLAWGAVSAPQWGQFTIIPLAAQRT